MENSYKVYNRYYCAILYEEDINFDKYFNEIQRLYQEVTYIRHDKDTIENKPKKTHIHIIFRVGKNARRIKSVAEEIGIPQNYLEGCNKDNMLLYFIHYKKKDKYQYNIKEVKGELREYLEDLMQEKKTDKEILKEILKEITKHYIQTSGQLLRYCIDNNYIEVYRKYSYIITNILKENKIVDKEK